MKMLLIIYSGSEPRLVPTLLDEHRADGWTELKQAHGAGHTGRREGTRAWPGDASVYFSILPEPRVEELTAALRQEAARLDEGDRLHVAVLPTETFF